MVGMGPIASPQQALHTHHTIGQSFDMSDRCVVLRTTLGDTFAFQYRVQVR